MRTFLLENSLHLGKKKNPQCTVLSMHCGFLAEKEGFEPSLRSSRTTPLAGVKYPLKMLDNIDFVSHMSVIEFLFAKYINHLLFES